MKRIKLAQDMQRLHQLDTLLRGDGVNVPAIAEEWHTTPRAVHRYLDVLRDMVGPTEAARGDDQHFWQTYAGKPRQMYKYPFVEGGQ